MSLEAITEHRGRSRHRQIATLSGLTSTGRVRKGTRGKPQHGCIFCGKVYTRLEHLRRHQGKHKRGAYPCIAPGCTCTFHNPALLERHRRHDWCFPFELSETYLFRCPSRPELSHQSQVADRRSTSNAPATPSDDGFVSNSPTSAHDASSPEDTFNLTSFSPPSQYLQVPGWNNLHNRYSGGHSHRPMARSEQSSPAVMQSTHYDPTSSFLSGYPNPVPDYSTHYTFDRYIPGTDSATTLDPQAEDGHAAQVHQPALRHATSLGDYSSVPNLVQSQSFPLLPGQHVEPRYTGTITGVDSLSTHAYFHSTPPANTEHDYNALYSLGLLDLSSQSFNPVFEGGTQPTTVHQDQQQISSAEYPSTSGVAPLQPVYWMASPNASRSLSTGNINLQYLARWPDE
ncbi:hypothetical protein KCU94_g13536, partial [Aureobasidium melanogenum]